MITDLHEILSEACKEKYWPHRALIFGAVIFTIYFFLWPTSYGLQDRMLKEGFLFIFLPYLFLKLNGKSIRPQLNKRTLKNTVFLLAIFMPFYVIAGSVPEVRSYYPIWNPGTTVLSFLGLQVKQSVISIGTEAFYRGLLCVWIREIGPKSILVSPIAYAAAHIGKPGVEVIGSGPADIVFGYFDYRSESIIPSIVTHSIGMATVDYLVMQPALLPRIGMLIETIISVLI